MPDIVHRVGINSSPEKVFAALTTIDGLSHWWIKDTSGDPKPGGIINFGFCDMKVLETRPNELVRWKCVRGPDEWLDTEVTFRLKPELAQTFVLFTHANWKAAVDFMHHCSTKWATFLLSMRDWLERNLGHPFPEDVKIHVGD